MSQFASCLGQRTPSDDMEHERRLLKYEHWANRRVLAALQGATNNGSRSLQLLAHICAGIIEWARRLDGETETSTPIWPTLTLRDCEIWLTRAEESLTRLESILLESQPEDLEATISYTNQHGLSYKTKRRDALSHLFAHGAYHRGQIAADLRAGGGEPVNTDFITYVRELAGERWRP